MEGSNNGIIIVLLLVLAGVVVFFALQKKEERKPGLFESLGGIADGLSSKAGGGLLGFL